MKTIWFLFFKQVGNLILDKQELEKIMIISLFSLQYITEISVHRLGLLELYKVLIGLGLSVSDY